ncbi:DUF1836 domain-containing protein [Anaerovoracaceae bacterium 41-7]|jgi:DNA-binding transcriptional MerR regulator|uniref:DUF1836 domain-containing protein n=1 Tax=Anaerotruncus colihominis TaxID=169435 RepID=A0A845QG99_9FIRM|nr:MULTISPECIES: DUF1836 domain-containing protein [Clostridia]MCI9476541.1 DUF1836 domain-containing protein [Emergencia sp.]MCI9640743.1 DUF1836 domain-containing protein [Emergencia sp.]NBH60366.1 DUF1836 domain-containing protein [Anaerotruncus colihominis]NCE99294.1 DUF1836 domain-containing protein [Emergencia sp. 1XD21-10]NCF01020.1 DUF1836 domain-containing protein [Anaerotruncus sp. 80]
MEELKLFKEQLKNMRPEGWDQIPDIDLYMDQVISYMSRQHIGLEPLGDESLTAAMINNYVKHGLLPRAKGKRYSREHLAYLTAICLLKQVLSVSETGALLEKEMEHSDIRTFYDQYLEILDETFTETASRLCEEESKESLAELALTMAVESYAKMLACKKILKEIAPAPEAKK